MNKEEYFSILLKMKEYEKSKIEDFSKVLPRKSLIKVNGVLLLTGFICFDRDEGEAYTFASKLNSNRSLTLNGKNHLKIFLKDLSNIEIKDKKYIYYLYDYVHDKWLNINNEISMKEYKFKQSFWENLIRKVQEKCPHDFDNQGYCGMCYLEPESKE